MKRWLLLLRTTRTSFLRIPILCFVVGLVGLAQQPVPPGQAPKESDDIVRVSTNLVQTGVTVLDKQGRLINNLQREQFELYVDRKPQAISFFESIPVDSSKKEVATKTNNDRPASVEIKPDIISRERGRAVFFFVDDQHLAQSSCTRAQKSILHFIDEIMGRNDQAAIVSASGQIGFLQQLTGNKAVLKAAVSRLNPIPNKARDSENPSIGEYAALQITEQHDPDLFRYYVDQTMKAQRMEESERPIAESMVQGRARTITRQSDANNKNTLETLMGLVHSIAKVPGRKVLIFISDGFVLNLFGSDAPDLMAHLSDAAVRANVVIYSLDARGLSTDPQFDASISGGSDPHGVLGRALSSELSFSQEGLYALAADTGGRAQLNSNSLDDGISAALRETSVYYLLAWKPDITESQKIKFHHIEVKVTGHPELRALVQKGYFAVAVDSPAKELAGLTSSMHLTRQLPVALSLGYGQAPGNRMTLTVAMEINKRILQLNATKGVEDLNLEFLGVVVDSHGKTVGSFARRVDMGVSKPSAETDSTLNYFLRVNPGVYQVRVAAVDSKHKDLGEATDWIEIPSIEAGAFSLSSIYADEPRKQESTRQREINFRRLSSFAQGSRFFLTIYIYNAARKGAPPAVSLQIKILRDGQIVSTTSDLHPKIDKATDQSAIPFSAEIALKTLPVGRYVLQISAIDGQTKATASRELEFAILPASDASSSLSP